MNINTRSSSNSMGGGGKGRMKWAAVPIILTVVGFPDLFFTNKSIISRKTVPFPRPKNFNETAPRGYFGVITWIAYI